MKCRKCGAEIKVRTKLTASWWETVEDEEADCIDGRGHSPEYS